MATRKKLTDEELADRLTDIAVEHLDTLSAEERRQRVAAFEKSVTTSCGKRQSGRATRVSSSRTRRNRVYARGRG